ncbi:putative AAA+ superfamily ATPase [Pedobacter africanus]|uniref:ATP-binding protein n=1 Tax=Pedobacter africanus TaxID=151894 RepID=UPI003395FC86
MSKRTDMDILRRDNYLNQLSGFIDKPLIKILTGIRRSDKSSVLMLLKQELLSKGINQENIIHINLESMQYADLDEARKLYAFVNQQIERPQKYYILLDEIQEVRNWEKAINSFLVDFDVDIYLTGSNSHLLSSELATYLAGRYIEIPIYTLSFSEYLQFRKYYFQEDSKTYKTAFLSYLRLGGFPVIHTADYTEDTAYKVVYDIYSSVILRDTVQRFKIRDVELLERVVKYVFDNIGNSFSGKNVADYFKSQQRKIDLNTVYNYLYALEGAFIIYRIPRYDVKGKELLKTQEKFFVSDTSLIYSVMGYRDRIIAGILENMVMLELKRKGFTVYIGKLADKEIDFIAEKSGNKIYVQVTYKLESESTITREFDPLIAIRDQYPKYVVSMDEQWKESVEGVRHIHISDFLLMETYT